MAQSSPPQTLSLQCLYLRQTLCSRPPCCRHVTSPTNKKPQQSPTLEGPLLRGTFPATAPCWEPLSSLIGLDICPPRVTAQRDAGITSNCTAGTRDVCKGENSRTNCKRAGERQKPVLNFSHISHRLSHLTHQLISPLYYTSCVWEEHPSPTNTMEITSLVPCPLLVSSSHTAGIVQYCCSNTNPFCSLWVFSCRVFLCSWFLVWYQALPSWRNFCHEYFRCIHSFTVTLWH